MKPKNQTPKALVELGTASVDTRGGPWGEIELTGFIPRAGIIRD
jgi:hypothetical protein